MACASQEREAELRLLIAAGASLTATDIDGETALHKAAYYGRSTLCRILLDEGCDFSSKNKAGKTAAQLATENHQDQWEACVAMLAASETAAGALASALEGTAPKKFRFPTPQKYQPAPAGLSKAIYDALSDNIDKSDLKASALAFYVQEWAGNNSAIDGYRDEDGRTPLLRAAYFGHAAAIRLLVAAGAHIGAVDHLGNTALHWTAENSDEKSCRFLVGENASISVKNRAGASAYDLGQGKDTPTAMFFQETKEAAAAAGGGGGGAQRRR